MHSETCILKLRLSWKIGEHQNFAMKVLNMGISSGILLIQKGNEIQIRSVSLNLLVCRCLTCLKNDNVLCDVHPAKF